MKENMNKHMVSVLVPCFNEAETINVLHEVLGVVLNRLAYLHEIIFIDDGSNDNTLELIEGIACQDETIRYISFSRNFGKESAILAGLEHATGDCVVILDADLQHPPELIPQMIEFYEQGFDQVIAKRTRLGDSKRSIIFAKLYYILINKLVDIEMKDGAGDFRLLSRRAVEAILSLRERNRFSKGLFSWIGFPHKYIEYQNCPRFGGITKWSFSKLLRYGIDGILSFNVQPLRLCIYMGAILLGVSVAYVAWVLFQIIMVGVISPGYFTTITIVLVLGGVQLISLGVIGEYVGRIYYETKLRPAYIVKDTNFSDSILDQNK